MQALHFGHLAHSRVRIARREQHTMLSTWTCRSEAHTCTAVVETRCRVGREWQGQYQAPGEGVLEVRAVAVTGEGSGLATKRMKKREVRRETVVVKGRD